MEDRLIQKLKQSTKGHNYLWERFCNLSHKIFFGALLGTSLRCSVPPNILALFGKSACLGCTAKYQNILILYSGIQQFSSGRPAQADQNIRWYTTKTSRTCVGEESQVNCHVSLT